jgi:hypothetical protein
MRKLKSSFVTAWNPPQGLKSSMALLPASGHVKEGVGTAVGAVDEEKRSRGVAESGLSASPAFPRETVL